LHFCPKKILKACFSHFGFTSVLYQKSWGAKNNSRADFFRTKAQAFKVKDT
jgi:hypothetical protein